MRKIFFILLVFISISGYSQYLEDYSPRVMHAGFGIDTANMVDTMYQVDANSFAFEVNGVTYKAYVNVNLDSTWVTVTGTTVTATDTFKIGDSTFIASDFDFTKILDTISPSLTQVTDTLVAGVDDTISNPFADGVVPVALYVQDSSGQKIEGVIGIIQDNGDVILYSDQSYTNVRVTIFGSDYTGNALGIEYYAGDGISVDQNTNIITNTDHDSIAAHRTDIEDIKSKLNKILFPYSIGIYNSIDTVESIKVYNHISITNDGNNLYTDNINDTIYHYILSEPYDISTATLNDSIVRDYSNRSPMFISDNGKYIYNQSQDASHIVRDSLGTANDLSTINRKLDSLSVTGGGNFITVSKGGEYLYTTDVNTDIVYQYKMTTSYDLSTASLNHSFTFENPRSTYITSNGRRLFIAKSGTDEIYSYKLTTPYDISTANFDTVTKTEWTSHPQAFIFSDTGLKFIFAAFRTIYIYNLEL